MSQKFPNIFSLMIYHENLDSVKRDIENYYTYEQDDKLKEVVRQAMDVSRDRIDVLDKILDSEYVTVDTQTPDYSRTPLHLCIFNGDFHMLKYFLNKGADTNIYDYQRKTPKEYALINNVHKAVNIIEFYILVIKDMVNYDNLSNPYALPLYSIWLDNYEALSRDPETITRNVGDFDVNADISFFGPAIHTACAVGTSHIETMCDIFIKHGADINKINQDEDGDTPLHLAMKWKDYSIFQYLLNKGADVNIADKHGQTVKYLIQMQNTDKSLMNEDFNKHRNFSHIIDHHLRLKKMSEVIVYDTEPTNLNHLQTSAV